MDYRVKNGDTGYWMTYRRDNDGHYSVVHPGLPYGSGSSFYSEPCDYRYETVVKRSRACKPTYYFRNNLDYLFTEIETKTTRTRRDVFENRFGGLVTRKYRPTSTLRTELYLNY